MALIFVTVTNSKTHHPNHVQKSKSQNIAYVIIKREDRHGQMSKGDTIVSKAADRSNNMSAVISPFARFKRMSLLTESRADSVEWPTL